MDTMLKYKKALDILSGVAGTNLYLKQTTLTFWTKFFQNGIFDSE